MTDEELIKEYADAVGADISARDHFLAYPEKRSLDALRRADAERRRLGRLLGMVD